MITIDTIILELENELKIGKKETYETMSAQFFAAEQGLKEPTLEDYIRQCLNSLKYTNIPSMLASLSLCAYNFFNWDNLVEAEKRGESTVMMRILPSLMLLPPVVIPIFYTIAQQIYYRAAAHYYYRQKLSETKYSNYDIICAMEKHFKTKIEIPEDLTCQKFPYTSIINQPVKLVLKNNTLPVSTESIWDNDFLDVMKTYQKQRGFSGETYVATIIQKLTGHKAGTYELKPAPEIQQKIDDFIMKQYELLSAPSHTPQMKKTL